MYIHCSSKRFKLIEPSLNLDTRIQEFNELLVLKQLAFQDLSDEDVIKRLVKMAAFTRVMYGDNSLQMAISHLILGYAYVDKKSYWVQGEHHTSDAVLHAENNPTSAQQLRILLESYYLLGYCRLKRGKNNDALEASMAAINCMKDLEILGHSVASCMDKNIGYKVHILAGHCSPSPMLYYKEALESPGPTVKNVFIYQMISKCHENKGDLVSALKSAKQSYDLAMEFSDMGLQADATRFLGECEIKSSGHNCINEGMTLLRKAIVLYTSNTSGLDITTLSTYDVLVETLINQEMYTDAIDELNGIKEAKIMKFGEYSKQVADLHKSLGSLYLIQDKTKEALSQFKKCLSVLNVIQTKPTDLTVSIRNTITSLETNAISARPNFKLY